MSDPNQNCKSAAEYRRGERLVLSQEGLNKQYQGNKAGCSSDPCSTEPFFPQPDPHEVLTRMIEYHNREIQQHSDRSSALFALRAALPPMSQMSTLAKRELVAMLNRTGM